MNFDAEDNTVPLDCQIAEGVSIGRRVVLAGEGIVIRENVTIEPAAVISAGVVIGQGALIRTGAVVLRSVPANAIVEGNPAKVVGYLDARRADDRSQPRLIDTQSFAELVRPNRVSLGVGESTLYLMRSVTDARGSLTVGEVPTEVPFAPKRYFTVYDVPSVELRGEHAHRLCKQFLICLHGSCRVLLDDGKNRCEIILDSPELGVFMPEMIWGTQYRYSKDAVLLVFASHAYDANDYLRTYDEFLAELGSG